MKATLSASCLLTLIPNHRLANPLALFCEGFELESYEPLGTDGLLIRLAPNARVVYDLFHVIAKFGREVVDRIRVDQANRLLGTASTQACWRG